MARRKKRRRVARSRRLAKYRALTRKQSRAWSRAFRKKEVVVVPRRKARKTRAPRARKRKRVRKQKGIRRRYNRSKKFLDSLLKPPYAGTWSVPNNGGYRYVFKVPKSGKMDEFPYHIKYVKGAYRVNARTGRKTRKRRRR